MTREKSKKKLWLTGKLNTLAKVECDEILNQVYDELESRTCENCKFLRLRAVAKNECECEHSEVYEVSDESDFGCNKWESR